MKIVYLLGILAIAGCSSDMEKPEEGTLEKTAEIALVFPENNSECMEGTVLNTKESSVTFEWEEVKKADSYELKLKDLETGKASVHSAATHSVSVTLKRGVAYSWHVESNHRNSPNEGQSETWVFYNAGEANAAHVPFPAEAVTPENNSDVTVENNSIVLKWKGNDLDNDIESYDIYFDENEIPELYNSEVKDTLLAGVPVDTGRTYYWKIKTRDANGNTSLSDVNKFTVN